MRYFIFLFLISGFFSVVAQNNSEADSLKYPSEKHLKNIRQLTFGGENAEAYFSFAGDKLVFQRSGKMHGLNCDQIFFTSLSKKNKKNSDPASVFEKVSTGKGRTTCSYFLPGDSLILYASTHLAVDSD